MNQHSNEYRKGVLSALGAYVLWGVLPMYWKLLGGIPAGEILAHRIIWSLMFMVVVLLFNRKLKTGVQEFKGLILEKKQLFAVLMASLFISLNWFTFIWAVNHNHMVETSLGYYINPLVSVVLGVIIFKEKLNGWQIISFILATIAVSNLVFHFGSFPWIAFILAFSFGLYGLFKKIVRLGALVGMAIETLMIAPIALIYLFYIYNQTNSSSVVPSGDIMFLFIGAGVATAVPLILFATGVRRIPLYMVGFLQYLAPTIMLILGVFLYHETFTQTHLLSFSLIWVALIIFSLSRSKVLEKVQLKVRAKMGNG